MSSTFTLPLSQIDNYTGNRAYLIRRNSDGLETIFRVVNRTIDAGANTCTIYTDVTIPAGASTTYSYSEGFYRTTKRVNQIDLNFAAQIWGRNSNNELVDFAQFYRVLIKPYRDTAYTHICTVIIQGKRPDRLLRGLTIGSLPLDTYDVQIKPTLFADTPLGVSTIVLRDWGDLVLLATPPLNGGAPYVRGQGYTETNPSLYNGNGNHANTPSNSPQQGPTLQILNVNEIEYKGSTSRSRDLVLNGLATVEAKVQFDAQLNGNINFQFFVAQGIVSIKPDKTGTADTGSTGNAMVNVAGFTPEIPIGWYLFNLDKRSRSLVTAITATAILTVDSLNWEEGDRWLYASWGSTCWWPEIYAYLALDPRFGLSNNFSAFEDIDWQSIIDSSRWCAGSNEHGTPFAWHGILKDSKEIAAINAEMAKQVLLFPCKRSGRAGFFPQKTPNNSNGAIYNSSNANKFRLEYAAIDQRAQVNQLTVVYRELEQYWLNEPELQFAPQSVTATTWNAAKGLDVVFQRVMQFPNCTSRVQAIKTAQILLNIARYGGLVSVSFSANTIESLSLPVGDLFRVQTVSTLYDAQQSGMVVEKAGNLVRLDRDPALAEGLTTSSSAGVVDVNMNFILADIQVGDIAVNLDSGIASTITSVSAQSLTCTPPIPIDTYYRIFDLTPLGLAAVVGGTTTSIPLPFTTSYLNGHIWYDFGMAVDITDTVLIGKNKLNDRLFQCLSCAPTIGAVDSNGTAPIESPIIGANWTPKFYDYSDIEVTTRDATINPAI